MLKSNRARFSWIERRATKYSAHLEFRFPILNQARVDKLVCEAAQNENGDYPQDVSELFHDYIVEKGITCESNDSNGFLVNSISFVLVAISAVFK